MSKKGFYFDSKRCVGCRTCQVACKDKHDLPIGVIYRKVRTFETGSYPEAKIYHYSSTCNHCENPKCVGGCPTGAMYKAEDGTVQHNDSMCIGCQYCMWNCPYGVPQYVDELDVVHKCDACVDLIAKGRSPKCVSYCSMRCLEFGDLDELRAKHGNDLVSELPILPKADITNPSVLIKPRACALNKDFTEKEV